jgi:hypothetical protein
MEQLERIKVAIWYDYLTGRMTYTTACDIYEMLLGPKNELLRETE